LVLDVSVPKRRAAAVVEGHLPSAPVKVSKETPMKEAMPEKLTLHDVRIAIERRADLRPRRRRELLSALSRAAKLFKEDLGRLPLDLPALAERLAAISPVACGIPAKSLATSAGGCFRRSSKAD
jgi:hypothetical protein